MSESAFLTEWRSRLAEAIPGLQLVGLDHPIDIFVGSNDTGNPKVTIQTKAKPREPVLSGIVLVDRRQGAQNYWQLSLTLQDLRFQEVFLRLVDDVYLRSGSAEDEESALRIANSVFDEWRRLLQARPAGVLTKEALRGLVGEVWLLLNRFSKDRPIDEAIVGWLGPLNAHQDFWYEASGLHEAKAIGPTMSAVKVSSEYQLDPLDENLELIVLSVADAPETAVGAVNLVQLVAQVKSALDHISASEDDLRLRMARLGVDLKHPYYAEHWFVMSSLSTYSVGSEFPAIRASDLPQGINRTIYRIDLASIEPFKTSYEPIP